MCMYSQNLEGFYFWGVDVGNKKKKHFHSPMHRKATLCMIKNSMPYACVVHRWP